MLVPEIIGPLSDASQALLWYIEYLSIHNNSKNDGDFTEFDSSIDNKLPHQKSE